MKRLLPVVLLFSCALTFGEAAAQTTVKKIVLEGFWWNYYNNNYPAGWSNYVAELAPRLKALGIDAVWLPPDVKNDYGTGSVGYAPYDDYDLGDKLQKGTVKTRVGDKNELLRAIAVLHANGIEVIQDIVANHVSGAGDTIANAGIDPDAWDNKYKLFRYTCYGNPLTLGTINEYRNRTGRFPKNWENFHPNPHDNCNTGDICSEYFGPDISYADSSAGQTNLTPSYDPNQYTYNPFGTGGTTGNGGNGYMRRGVREWLTWYKKQAGFDGVRLDAAKNYDYAAAADFIYNLQFNSGWASGGNKMFAVGEIVGSSSDEDNWANAVNNSGGTFDFNLRGAIKSMVDGGGYYNMANIPGAQQTQRVQYYGAPDYAYVHRTVTFVNNHDTFRPNVDSTGNYTSSWDTNNELDGGHIDPVNNSRTALAYATIMAMDGNVQIFFEDLFDIGSTGKRYTHLPANTIDLPVRSPLQNLIWCHQNLDFKDGAYKVRSTTSGGNVYFNGASGCVPSSSDADLLIIERSNKAVIGLNDRGDQCGWQSAYVDTDFPQGTVLKDYSGANGTTTYTVPADHRVLINVPPVYPSDGHYGYAVWAPVNAAPSTAYTPQRAVTTTQEWEMADDLGDSHCSSLGQGGQLPALSAHQRVAGKLFAAGGSTVTYTVYPAASGNNITAALWDNNGNKLDETSGVATSSSPLTHTYTATADGWIIVKAHNTDSLQAGQKIFIKMDYTSPANVNTLTAANMPAAKACVWTANKNTADPTDCGNWEEGKMPDATTDVVIPANATPYPQLAADMTVRNIMLESGAQMHINTGVTLTVTGNWTAAGIRNTCGKVAFAGTAAQQISGANTFCTLQVNNAQGITTTGDNTVSQQLMLTAGKLNIGDHLLTLNTGATIAGGTAASYVQTTNSASGAGYLVQNVSTAPVTFPVGNSSYTPVTLTNTGTAMSFKIRDFGQVLDNGTSGSPVTTMAKINKTWVITPATATGANASVTAQWNGGDADVSFTPLSCYMAKNTGGAGQTWQQISTTGAASGSNPYSATATGITTFSKFTMFSSTATTLPVSLLTFTGTRNGLNDQLTWTAAHSDNTASYEVQYSADGAAFTAAGTVKALRSAGSQAYHFTHSIAADSRLYYRLKMISGDGSFAYSNIISLQSAGAASVFTVYPNPGSGHFEVITGNVSGVVRMKIATASGAVLREIFVDAARLSAALNAALSGARAGIYSITFSQNDLLQTLRLVKQ